MHLRYLPYTLALKRTFAISTVSRSHTPAVLVELSHDNICGYGEASLPPYRSETVGSVEMFIRKVRLQEQVELRDLTPILSALHETSDGNGAACAAVDMALHDWFGKRYGFAWVRKWGLDTDTIPPTSFTNGIASTEEIRAQVKEVSDFASLKIKLGSERDKEIIGAVREMTDQKIRVDVNQGWKDRSEALTMIEWLAPLGVELVEQPLPKDQLDDMLWLKERSPLPLVADESVEGYADIETIASLYDGINVKLMKSGGMAEAFRMISRAKELGLNVMLGCMTETSCAISAAAQLAPLADWVDLDGALLISNDPFDGAKVENGRVIVPARFGNGVALKQNAGKDLGWIAP